MLGWGNLLTANVTKVTETGVKVKQTRNGGHDLHMTSVLSVIAVLQHVYTGKCG
jgi:hypothetical protein